MAEKVYCEHCQQYVSKKTERNHMKAFITARLKAPQEDQTEADSKVPDSKVFCQHCDSYVSRKTKYRHDRKQMSRTPTDLCETDSSTDDEEFEKTVHYDPEAELESRDIETNCPEIDESEQDSGDSVWDEEEDDDIESDLSNSTSTPKRGRKSLLEWLLYSVLFLQTAYSLSNAFIDHLLFFLVQLFSVLGRHSETCATLVTVFPKSFRKLKELLNVGKDDFAKYVVCENCLSLHSYDKVLQDGKIVCKETVYACRAVNSSRKRGRAKCNGVLARRVILNDGKETIYPYKVYCLNGIISSLERLMSRPNFGEECNRWRHRPIVDMWADIYDGNVWKSFVDVDGSNFLQSDYHFGLALNVDWFAPYKRRRDISIGALYMVVLNLPREKRFKSENAILLGIIPALKKEPGSLNSFLAPIVSELKALWNGVLMSIPGKTSPVSVRAALMCAAADIPAARKMCGFLGHAARQGCSHCTKPFITDSLRDVGIPNYSIWPPRNRQEHLKYSEMALRGDSVTAKSMIEGRYGYRFTELLNLDYFNPSQFYAIDPMHNLFLGTAKRMFSHWVENGILTKESLESISNRISNVNVDYEIGRIPKNIVSNYSTMTAKEWKNWVLVYSMFVLDGNLPSDHLAVWHTFVLACTHICRPTISQTNIDIAHGLFVKFVNEVRRVYGPQFVTPNMHLHCHLKECVENFGCIYSFWLFSFERYNGILTGYPTNKRSIECQLMRKFDMMSAMNYCTLDAEYETNINLLFQHSQTHDVQPLSISLFKCKTMPLRDIPHAIWTDLRSCSFRRESFKMVNLTCGNIQNLCQTYAIMYSTEINSQMMCHVAKRYKTVRFGNQYFSSRKHHVSGEGDFIWANWSDDNSKVRNCQPRPAKVKHFLVHTLELRKDYFLTHVFAYVDWFKSLEHPCTAKSPLSVWSMKTQNEGPACYLPIQRVIAKIAWSKRLVNGHPYLFACPLPERLYI